MLMPLGEGPYRSGYRTPEWFGLDKGNDNLFQISAVDYKPVSVLAKTTTFFS